MLFKPRHCPNCGIRWQDHVRPGVCDLCGYDLSIGGQKAPTTRRTVHIDDAKTDRRVKRPDFAGSGYRPFLPGIEVRDPGGSTSSTGRRTVHIDDPRADRRVKRPAFGRAGYRPFLPGIEVRDPGGLTSSVDPRTLSEMSARMNAVLGRQSEGGGKGRLNAKRMEKAVEVIRSLHGAMASRDADVFLDSPAGELPIRLTVAAEGQGPEDLSGPPVRDETIGPAGSRFTKILRVILFLAAVAGWLLLQFLEEK